MGYSIGQELTYTSPTGKQEKVIIVKRAEDYENGFIDELNYKGNCDYFVSVERNGKIDHIFCKENQLF